MPGISEAKCVLVIGATSGIGRALALAIHDVPSEPTVIVAGRRQERIDELCQQRDRIRGLRVDLTSGRDALKAFADSAVTQYPQLDAIIYSSGIQHGFDFGQPDSIDLDLLEAELTTNYLSFVTLIKYFMPHFLKLDKAGNPSFIVPVTSNLGTAPTPFVPDYCATKSAMHMFALTLFMRLSGTNIHVMELIPPLVESELHGQQGNSERLKAVWMPIDKFTAEAMERLCRGGLQIPVGRAKHNWEKYERKKVEELVLSRC